ncbi:MAG: TonB-dependent receptor [Bacteroidales bacterium]
MSKLIMACVVSIITGAMLSAQNGPVRGTVLAESDGTPIVDAFVVIEGTDMGTETDREGRFSFSTLPSGAKSLKVTCVGMQAKSQPIAPSMTIYLKDEFENLDEVMVVAYGIAKKSSYAGSASIVRSDEISKLPVTSFEGALNGKVAGLQVTSTSGQAGSVSSMRIRGTGSMNASNEPLYVIDGVPVNSGNAGFSGDYIYTSNDLLSTLNPEDIESVSVLKDAAASSLYGSRAANGVIIITTKSGREGKPVVSFNASVGFTPSWATGNYETAGVQENVNMLYMIFHNYRTAGKGESDEKANAYALAQLNKKFNKHGYSFSTEGTGAYDNVIISDYDNSGRAGKYYDWDDAYYRTAVYKDLNLSVSGASPTTSYYASLGYMDSQGRLRVNDFTRASAKVNLNQKIGRFFELGTNVRMAKTDKSGYNDTRNTSANSFFQTRNLLWGLYWPTDYSTGEAWTTRYGSYAQNNKYYDNEWDNSSKTLNAAISETATIHLLEGLDLKSIFSYDNSTVKESLYYSALHYNGASTNGSITEMRTIYEKTVSSTTASYTKAFGSHNLAFLAGFEAEKNNTDYTRSEGENLPTSKLHTVSTAGLFSAAGYSWGNSMVSLLSKLDYNYAERYFASVSFRRDGSSKLSTDKRWGDFWSVAGAWRLTEENFLKETPWLSNLRLRASYGVNGTLPSDNYGYMYLMSYTNHYLGNAGGTISSLANDDLSWETNYSTNVGVDFGFFKGRLNGTVEFYNRDSKDLIQDVPVSQVTGLSSMLKNIGRINNHGFEIQLDGEIMRRNGLLWTASGNISFLKSKVKSLYNGAEIIWYDPTGGDTRAQYLYREGESTYAFYGYEWAGVDKTNGKSVYYVNDPDDSKAGDFIYKGRGATYDYDSANYKIIGNAVPFATGGFNTNLSFKGIDLALGFTYKIGGDLYDGAEKDVADDGYYWERIRSKSYYENMWTPTNTDGSQPALSGLDLTDAMEYSSRHLYNASYLRLKNLTLGYTIPGRISSKACVSRARVYFTASNLLTFSSYKEADPEVNEYGTRGWETPIGKTYVFGVELQF